MANEMKSFDKHSEDDHIHVFSFSDEINRTQELNSFCTHTENHHIHLCSLTAEGRKQMVACLAQPADYKCGRCGQKARLAENCCGPIQLPELSQLGDGADNLFVEKCR